MKIGVIFLCLSFLSFPSVIFAQQTPKQPSLFEDEGIEIGLLINQTPDMKNEEEKKTATIEPLKTFPLSSHPYKISLSPDSKYLSLSTKNGRLIIYDLKDMTRTLDKEFSRVPLYALSSHPLKNEVMIGDRDGLIGIFDLDKKILQKTVYELKSPISDIAVSPDGGVFFVAHFGGTVTFYYRDNTERYEEINPHEKDIYSVSINKAASHLATSSRDKTVKIISLGSRRVESTLKEHKAIVLTCQFSGDEQFLASGGADRQVIVYEKRGNSFKPYFAWAATDWITSLKFFGGYLFVGSKDGKLRIFDYENKSLLKVVDAGSPIIGVDANQNYLCAVSTQELKIYSTEEALE